MYPQIVDLLVLLCPFNIGNLKREKFQVFSFFSYKLWNVYLSKWLITINCQRRQYLCLWLGIILSTSIMDMKALFKYFLSLSLFFLFLCLFISFNVIRLLASQIDFFIVWYFSSIYLSMCFTFINDQSI